VDHAIDNHDLSATARSGYVPSAGVALLALLVATGLWGSTFVFIQAVETTDSTKYLSPAALTFGRFAVASLAFLPFGWRALRYWRAGIELGFLMWAGYATQAVGLLYTSVPRMAFLSSLYVILLPIGAFVRGRKVSGLVWVGAVLAVVGTGLLSSDGGPPNHGDAWALATAVAWAFFIERFGHHCRRAPTLAVAAMNVWGVTLFSLAWFVASRGSLVGLTMGAMRQLPWATLIYLGVAATSLVAVLQAIGQRKIAAPRAAILYTLEPVFACVAGFAYRGIVLGASGVLGAFLILLAAVLSQWPGLREGRDSVLTAETQRTRSESIKEDNASGPKLTEGTGLK